MKKVLIATVVAFALFGLARVASADGPDEHASCAGILSVFNTQNSPSRSDIAHLFKQAADFFGIPPGAIVTLFAQEHGGSVPDCLLHD